MKRREIQTMEELSRAVSRRWNLKGAVFQSLDLTGYETALSKLTAPGLYTAAARHG